MFKYPAKFIFLALVSLSSSGSYFLHANTLMSRAALRGTQRFIAQAYKSIEKYPKTIGAVACLTGLAAYTEYRLMWHDRKLARLEKELLKIQTEQAVIHEHIRNAIKNPTGSHAAEVEAKAMNDASLTSLNKTIKAKEDEIAIAKIARKAAKEIGQDPQFFDQKIRQLPHALNQFFVKTSAKSSFTLMGATLLTGSSFLLTSLLSKRFKPTPWITVIQKFSPKVLQVESALLGITVPIMVATTIKYLFDERDKAVEEVVRKHHEQLTRS